MATQRADKTILRYLASALKTSLRVSNYMTYISYLFT